MLESEALRHWVFEPSIVLGLVLFVLAYVTAAGPLRTRFADSRPVTRGQELAFAGAVLLIGIALLSPLDTIGDHYLFSAHMVQHMLVVLPMPILLLLGIPGWMLRPLVRPPQILAAARALTAPVAAFSIFNIIFAVYHLPAMYELALQNELFHIAVHLLLMATAVLNWWPVLGRLPEVPSLHPGVQVLYLFFESLTTSALPAYIVLTPHVLYSTYLSAPRLWEIAPLADQQLAGLIMWIPGALVYLSALTVVFFHWFGQNQAPMPSNR